MSEATGKAARQTNDISAARGYHWTRIGSHMSELICTTFHGRRRRRRLEAVQSGAVANCKLDDKTNPPPAHPVISPLPAGRKGLKSFTCECIVPSARSLLKSRARRFISSVAHAREHLYRYVGTRVWPSSGRLSSISPPPLSSPPWVVSNAIAQSDGFVCLPIANTQAH